MKPRPEPQNKRWTQVMGECFFERFIINGAGLRKMTVSSYQQLNIELAVTVWKISL